MIGQTEIFVVRLLVEIILAAVLIALAWDKPWKDRLRETPVIGDKLVAAAKPSATPVRAVARPVLVPAPTPSGAWMWEKNGTLDRKTKPTPH